MSDAPPCQFPAIVWSHSTSGIDAEIRCGECTTCDPDGALAHIKRLRSALEEIHAVGSDPLARCMALKALHPDAKHGGNCYCVDQWCDDCQAERPCLCEQKEWEMEQAINDAEGEAREEWPENWGEQ